MPNRQFKDASLDALIDRLTKDTAVDSKEARKEKRHVKKRRREEQQRPQQYPPSVPPPFNSTIANVSAPKQNSRKEVKRLASRIQEIMQNHVSGGYQRPYQIHSTSRTVKHNKRKWETEYLQPRNSDYGGIGLARPSLFLSFLDPSFVPKLEEEFAEHIPGFFGKQRTKSVKKQQPMLWQRMKQAKVQKINGKSLSNMTPDERVEAMIKAGMI